jgi:nicotinate-nucleotide--dimethylbenzimidazole phosphoribosyltransferase
MSAQACDNAIKVGAQLIIEQQSQGCNCIGFGEMGIGNTSSAALLMHCLTQLPLADCVGRGTGLNDEQLRHKTSILQQARNQHPIDNNPLTVLATFGGFEIAMLVGAMLQAAALGMVIMIDGFISTAALLVASKINPRVCDYCIFSHVSNEYGHQQLLEQFYVKPLLQLDLRLGEGSGVALAYPLLHSAVLFTATRSIIPLAYTVCQ